MQQVQLLYSMHEGVAAMCARAVLFVVLDC